MYLAIERGGKVFRKMPLLDALRILEQALQEYGDADRAHERLHKELVGLIRKAS